MSRESSKWLNSNVLRGFTDKRGHAWHYSASEQGAESNHYPDAIPVDDVQRRLFGWAAEPRPILVPQAGYVHMVNIDPSDTDSPMVPDMDTPEGFRPVTGQAAWCRSDNGDVLGIHTTNYKGHQYGEWLLDNVFSLVGGQLFIANAGLLSNGAVAWVQIETPDNVQAIGGVAIRPFLLATTSFDGSIATTYKPGYTDVVCDNTRDMFLSERSEVYRVKHTRNSAFSAIDAQTQLNIVTESALREIQTLLDIDVTDAHWQAFVEAHAPIAADATKKTVTMGENLRGELTRLYNTDVRVSPWRGTAWGVVQAVNTFTHHHSIVRNVANGGGRFERNMMRAVQGGIAKIDTDAVFTLQTVIGRPILPEETTARLETERKRKAKAGAAA